MISKIAIKNFKSLKDIELECGTLNLLTGLNGMGKSSIIQALLLLRQSYESGLLQKTGLSLNDSLVKLGSGKDILYQQTKEDEISFHLKVNEEGNQADYDWIFGYQRIEKKQNQDGKEDDVVEAYHESDYIVYGEYRDGEATFPSGYENLPLFSNRFNYLHADRPVKNEYPTSNLNVIRRNSLGKHGEYTTHYLVHHGNELVVDQELLFQPSSENTLAYQVSEWMKIISPGVFVSVEKVTGVETAQLRYEFETPTGRSEKMLPVNVGFGMTYVLPVLVALLSAKPGDLLIIENPESHIHPKAQLELGKLMTKAASIGVQLFVETHSDHILNGIRIAIKQGVSHELVKVFFVQKEDEKSISSNVESPEIDQDGRISHWPKDFFDTWEYSLMDLL